MNPKFIIHGGWVEGSFLIWAEENQQSSTRQMIRFQYPFLFSPFELKLSLFRKDEASFYGTFLETDTATIHVPLENRQFRSPAGSTTVYQAEAQTTSFRFPIEGISLLSNEVVHHLPHLEALCNEKGDEWEIGEDFLFWVTFFSSIYSRIEYGQFQPTQEGKWQLTDVDWQQWADAMPLLCFALSKEQHWADLDSLEQQPFHKLLETVGHQLADDWIRSLFSIAPVQQAFSHFTQSVEEEEREVLLHHQPEQDGKKAKSLHRSTKEKTASFLEKIGAKPSSPFKWALALQEPATSRESWTVSLCIMDREDPSFVLDLDALMTGSHPWRSNPISALKELLGRTKQEVPLLHSLSLSQPTLSLTSEEAFSLFTNDDQTLESIGFQLIVPRWLKHPKNLRAEVRMMNEAAHSKGTDPLLNWQGVANFEYEIAIGSSTLSREEFIQHVSEKRPFLQVDGEWVSWDPSLADRLLTFLNDLETNEITHFDALRLANDNEQLPEGIDWQVTWEEEVEEGLQALFHEDVPIERVPSTLEADLRPYQIEGFSWLLHLRKLGFGGCLADDMGLGKSLQTISYMLSIIADEKEGPSAPFLLICPTSLISNWVHECKKFAPSMNVQVHHGQQRNQLEETDDWKADLVITSYSLAFRDLKMWQRVKWNGLILDEAQQIKNIETKQRQAVKLIPATHRLALTGTPIENRLRELWSIMDVLNPTYLGSLSAFTEHFIRPVEREQNDKQLQTLQQLIRPLLLRRKKSDPSLQLQLPEKREQLHYVHLTVEQAALYQAVVDDIAEKIESASQMERRALILKSLTKLKQICNHPAHFLKDGNVEEHDSEKWDLLLTLVEQINDHGEKVLIFTQYKEMGFILQKALSSLFKRDIPFLHGSLTREKRQEAIDYFQRSSDTPVFILSLKAGGVGLNLTAANHVIHYDRWWNPAVENQATDRAYRIGQTEDVTVHKLITLGTLEEKVDRMITEKQALADQILTTGDSRLTELTNKELLELIQL